MSASAAFMQKQGEIQRKLEIEVTEIKKIEQGNPIDNLTCRVLEGFPR